MGHPRKTNMTSKNVVPINKRLFLFIRASLKILFGIIFRTSAEYIPQIKEVFCIENTAVKEYYVNTTKPPAAVFCQDIRRRGASFKNKRNHKPQKRRGKIKIVLSEQTNPLL
jgi:hypothetical protein